MKTSIQIIIYTFLMPLIGTSQIDFKVDTEQKINSLFTEFEDTAGAAAAVVHKGQVLYQNGFGYANLENDIKVNTQSIFEVSSVGMHITATAIILLEQQGKLSLDDPIQKHLTTFPKYAKGEVSIRHCIHHSSGLRDYLDLIKITGRTQNINFTNEDGKELLRKQKELTITPGSDYRYSYSNYLALALIIEKVSGKSINEFAKAEIFGPLGMTNTFYYQDNEKIIKNRALIYGMDENEEMKLKQNFSFTACGDGRLYTNIEDMIKWMANFRSSKIGGNPKFMERLFERGILNNGEEMSYAYGLEWAAVNGNDVLGHNGWFAGATAMFLYTPKEDLAVITMGNHADLGVIGKAVQINNMILTDKREAMEEKPEEETTTTVKLSRAELENFCGSYFSYDIGYARKIYLKDDDLYYHEEGHDDALLSPMSKNEFRKMSGNNRTTLKFGNEGEGKALYLRYGERPPFTLLEFKESKLSSEQLNQFTGKYISHELNIIYDLILKENKLQIVLDETVLSEFNPLMSGLFNSAHDGYLKFEKNTQGEFEKFTLNDYSLGSMSFYKNN